MSVPTFDDHRETRPNTYNPADEPASQHDRYQQARDSIFDDAETEAIEAEIKAQEAAQARQYATIRRGVTERARQRKEAQLADDRKSAMAAAGSAGDPSYEAQEAYTEQVTAGAQNPADFLNRLAAAGLVSDTPGKLDATFVDSRDLQGA